MRAIEEMYGPDSMKNIDALTSNAHLWALHLVIIIWIAAFKDKLFMLMRSVAVVIKAMALNVPCLSWWYKHIVSYIQTKDTAMATHSKTRIQDTSFMLMEE